MYILNTNKEYNIKNINKEFSIKGKTKTSQNEKEKSDTLYPDYGLPF